VRSSGHRKGPKVQAKRLARKGVQLAPKITAHRRLSRNASMSRCQFGKFAEGMALSGGKGVDSVSGDLAIFVQQLKIYGRNGDPKKFADRIFTPPLNAGKEAGPGLVVAGPPDGEGGGDDGEEHRDVDLGHGGAP